MYTHTVTHTCTHYLVCWLKQNRVTASTPPLNFWEEGINVNSCWCTYRSFLLFSGIFKCSLFSGYVHIHTHTIHVCLCRNSTWHSWVTANSLVLRHCLRFGSWRAVWLSYSPLIPPPLTSMPLSTSDSLPSTSGLHSHRPRNRPSRYNICGGGKTHFTVTVL